jgi:phosphoenolpyruvate carboxykinase (ATP)
MIELAFKSDRKKESDLRIVTRENIFLNLSPAELVEHALANREGTLCETGALMVDTGTFTGRSPKDRFIVKEKETEQNIWWGDINLPMEEEKFERLFQKMSSFLSDKKLYIREAYAGADKQYRLNLKIINTLAWHNLFCCNMFLRPKGEDLENFQSDFTIICAPEFEADPIEDGTRQKNFAVLHLSKRILMIGGTAYAGEMKKGIFSVLNYVLPQQHNVLSMHCSANVGKYRDTAVFFGLSGTGKTTLSADPERSLIGDDEHGWDENSIFNFEGGCYAKVIDLSEKKEPEIWNAIKFGAILENTRFYPGTREVDYSNKEVTENTRTSYPIDHIKNALIPSIAGTPKHIFFLTADAFGVLPPISRLNKGQAMYHFISGYTAKVAGTEVGITEPKTTFSACFGAAFLPLHPTKYAALFGEKMEKQNVKVWLVNTGWTGGPYGVGKRMKLEYTRAMISAAIEGQLDHVKFQKHNVFGIAIPETCPNVPDEVLSPRSTWADKEAYDKKARELGKAFRLNFEKFKDFATKDILSGAPNW